MALSQIYTAVPGHIITAARWNNEFGNIYTNGTDVAFPLTKAVSYAGFTVTFDLAGVSTITSPSTTGFLLTVGAKAGAPGANGNLITVTASTFTDTATAALGTASLWTGVSIRQPTLAASNVITTTDAASLYIESAPVTGLNQTITNKYALLTGSGGHVRFGGNFHVSVTDTHTNTVDVPVTITSVTSGTPAAGIGTGVLFQSESQDENPSDVGQLQAVFSDRAAGSEDSYWEMLIRVAGAALSVAYRWVATTAFRAIFTHANSADRTYTLPNRTVKLESANVYSGSTATGSGSTSAHEGDVTISSSQALSGVHYYTNFTLDAGVTLTAADNSGGLCITASESITINGTIDCVGAASAGGTSGASATTEGDMEGPPGHSQPGGGGGSGGAGGGALFLTGGRGGSIPGVIRGGAGGNASNGSAGTQLTLRTITFLAGGAGGGGGGGSIGGGAGGRGGGSVKLIAPSIALGAASVLNTSGGAGAAGTAATNGGGGGGGGSGNIGIFTLSLTDSGCTFTQNGGGGGAGVGTGNDGGAGAAGVLQINQYPSS